MSARPPKGSVALVTGSSSGFGLLCCVELARAGFRVAASMRDLGRSQRLDDIMAQHTLRCDKVALDVADPASIARAVATVEAEIGPIEILVNNAGYGLAGFVEDMSMEELRAQLETNFFGLVEATKAVLPGMRARGRGRIINLSSMSGRLAYPGFGAYSASKFAVEGISEALRQELLGCGVYVVLVEPGMFRTDIFERNRRVAAAALSPSSPNFAVGKRLETLFERRLARSTRDPIAVAHVVRRAATAKRPRLRYRVGVDAKAITAVRSILPFSIWERAVAYALFRER